MSIAVRYASADGSHVLELRLSSPDAQRGQLFERKPGEPEPVYVGRGYSRKSTAQHARRLGLEHVAGDELGRARAAAAAAPELTGPERHLMIEAARAERRATDGIGDGFVHDPCFAHVCQSRYCKRCEPDGADEANDWRAVAALTDAADALIARGLLEVDWRDGRYGLTPALRRALHVAIERTPTTAGVALGTDAGSWPASHVETAVRVTTDALANAGTP